VSPVADPKGRRRGRNFENVKKGKGPTILKVFKVSPPAGVAGIDTWKAGKWRWHHDFLSFLNFASGPGAEGETLRNKLKTMAARRHHPFRSVPSSAPAKSRHREAQL
jgi:hypothetical protein